jgi:uncharacterized protein
MLTELKSNLKKGKKITFKIRVVPKSGKHEISGIMADGTIKIKLKSAPEKSKANQELIELLSDYFEIKYQHIMILSGETARLKLIEIHPE